MKYRVTREVHEDEEGNYSGRSLGIGEILYKCNQATYGCIGYAGIGLTFEENGDYPFFEFPLNAVEAIND